MQQCGTIYRAGKSRASDDERLDSFETCRADKKNCGIKLIIRIVRLVDHQQIRTSRCLFTVSGTVSFFSEKLPNYPIIYSSLTLLIFDFCV